MMIYKVLKRRDVAAIVIAIVVALTIGELLSSVGSSLSFKVIGNGAEDSYAGVGSSWRYMYALPILTAAIKLALLELTLRAYIYVSASMKKK